ncbi:aminodeoxychorismate synthase component I [Tumebacillus sp. ITR2]|uniref:aminodeoxychorismate synthase n=1 Tax=Tumebacillus amylolyticus TaxID=2801339 RepID=A0ABS1J6H1_9BACL|nr:aminodeoxychorismate synthase component I [Tumebacillus amylolyticus]MBL0385877.1 aminodeoxychorismate synthase component I [Tumebacillus amylolyticus]
MRLFAAWRKMDGALDAISLFARGARLPYSLWLDSGSHGRYMILAWEPVRQVELRHDDVECPFDRIDRLLAEAPKVQSPPADAPPYLSGVLGFLGYELGWGQEQIGESKPNPHEIPDGVLILPGKALIIDVLEKTTWAVAVTESDTAESAVDALVAQVLIWNEAPYETAKQGASGISEPTTASHSNLNSTPRALTALQPEITKSEYLDRIRRVKHYIREGDIFQANFTYQIAVEVEDADPWELYLALRETNGGTYAGYFNIPGYLILSGSPELFLRWDDTHIETIPIKGTRPRGTDEASDLALRNDLATSEKDRAELLMIVDLERNDLGKFCKPGSVEVPVLFDIEAHRTVWHQVAVVRGALPSNITAGAILKATFPGGSITGAPKIRAMQIIHELETSRRGIYTGALGFLDTRGTASWNIAIRTMTFTDDREIRLYVGGGIVADSDPEDEYLETQVKAQGMIRAINAWSRGKITPDWL